MKRRAAIEPSIGNLKADYWLSRNYFKGEAGDRADVVLAASAYNLAKLLKWFYRVFYFNQVINLLHDYCSIVPQNTPKFG